MKLHKSRRVCRREGQILIMTLLGITVLVGMAFYVYNTGVQVNDRLAMQGAADSATISGTVQLARGLNVVAMNNLSMAKLLASVVVLDSLPLATQLSLAEVTGFEACLKAQLRSLQAILVSVPDTREQNILTAAVSSFMYPRLVAEKAILTQVDAALNHNPGFDMRTTTNWISLDAKGQQDPTSHGKIWQAILALWHFSDATKTFWGVLGQNNAVLYGKSDKADVAFMTPVLPEMPVKPYEQCKFQDFQPLLRGSEWVRDSSFIPPAGAGPTGGRGGAIPDMVYPYRLGPYAKLLKWRSYSRTGGTLVTPPSGNASGLPSDGGGPSFGGSWTGGIITGYTAYGPVAWAMNNLTWWSNGNGASNSFGSLPDCNFSQYVSQMKDFKLEYMFGSQTIRQIHNPVMIPDYEQAKQAEADPKKNVPYRTYYFCVCITSSVPEGDSRWLQPNTCFTNVPGFGCGGGYIRILKPFGGWLDMQKYVDIGGLHEGMSWTRVGDYIWKGKTPQQPPPPAQPFPYSTSWPQIGIIEKDDPKTGKPIRQPLYFVEFRVFAGLDIGKSVDVPDPCNGQEADIARQVCPLELDTTKGDCAAAETPGTEVGADVGMRRTKFTFLGVARHGTTSNFWQQQFQRANPYGNMVAVAQAELFNNSSWDLWTQDWRAQLVPVSQWDDWASQMEAGAGDASATGGTLQPAEVSDVAAYLKRMNSQMVEPYIHH